MSSNAIERIREAESAADELVREASRSALQIVGEAERDAEKTRQARRDAAERAALSDVSRAQDGNRALFEQAISTIALETEALSKQADSRQALAIKAVIAAIS